MSDFLLNLARRSAGLSPVVHARSAPVIVELETTDASVEPAGERDVKPAAPVVVAQTLMSPPAPHAVTVRPQPVAALPISPAPARAAQRTSIASDIVPAEPARLVQRAADAPVVATPAETFRPGDATATALPQAANAKVASHRDVLDETSRLKPVEAQAPIIESRIEVATTRESGDASNAVVVTIKPAEQAVAVTPTVRAEPADERSVHVHIGSIDIVGPDYPGQTSAGITPAVPASAATVAATSSGFDAYRALRSYTPWTW